MPLELKGDALRVAFAKLRSYLAEGLEHHEVCEKMQLSWIEVEELRRKLLDQEAALVRRRPTEHTYVEYCLEMRRCMNDLDKVIDGFEIKEGAKEPLKNSAGYVGAVRAKADILDRMIKVGQDFGLIERVAEGKGLAAGEAIKNMANTELRAFILQEVNVFNTLLVQFGDKRIEEMDPGPLHQALSAPKHPVPKVQGHARGKVHAGRRVVRK